MGAPVLNGVVIVGVLPGPGRHPELVEGYREARRRGIGLVALTAYEPPDFWAVVPGTPRSRPTVTDEDLREGARCALIDTVTRTLTGSDPEDVARRVRCAVAPGPARGVLTEASAEAAILVIGTSRRADERHAGALSVAADVLRHARCPVRVVADGLGAPGSGDRP